VYVKIIASQRWYVFKTQCRLHCQTWYPVYTIQPVVKPAIVLSVVTYALPSFAGHLSKGDIARIDSLFRKAFRRGFCCHTISIDELISAADNKLFHQMSSKSHCLHPLLSTQRNEKLTNCPRKRGHSYQLPQIEFTLLKNSFINRCLFSYI